MYNGRTATLIGATVALFTCGAVAHATTPPDSAAPARTADPASPIRVSLADGTPGGLHEPDRGRAPSPAASPRAPGKPEKPSLPDSDSFVLLGMGIVFVGVLARQKRRFTRSGTILLR